MAVHQGAAKLYSADGEVDAVAVNTLGKAIRNMQRLTIIHEGDEEDLVWFDAIDTPSALSKPMSKSNSRQRLATTNEEVVVINEEAPKPLNETEAIANPVKVLLFFFLD